MKEFIFYVLSIYIIVSFIVGLFDSNLKHIGHCNNFKKNVHKVFPLYKAGCKFGKWIGEEE